MKLLGTVTGISNRGDLLVKGITTPTDGVQVVDPTGRKIGKVERVVGPVSDPYIIIRLQKGVNGTGLSGIQVYSQDGSGKQWSKKRGRRKG